MTTNQQALFVIGEFFKVMAMYLASAIAFIIVLSIIEGLLGLVLALIASFIAAFAMGYGIEYGAKGIAYLYNAVKDRKTIKAHAEMRHNAQDAQPSRVWRKGYA